MIDFVYPLGRGSRCGNLELRYSIRSVEKYAPMARKVAIATWDKLPAFIDPGSVLQLKVSDMYGHQRTLNTLRKALAACSDDRLTPDIVWMNDDIILTMPHPEFPHAVKGVLGPSHSKKSGDYFTACQHSVRYLKSKGIAEPRNFAAHRPLLLNRARFVELLTPVMSMMRPVLWGSVYCNLARVAAVPMSDAKVHTPDQFFATVEHAACVSLGDNVPQDMKVQAWLDGRFNAPSRFERGAAKRRTA